MSLSNSPALDQPSRCPHAAFLHPCSHLTQTPCPEAGLTAREISARLSDLSPASALNALRKSEVMGAIQPSDEKSLSRSVEQSSTKVRKYGIKTTFAAQKLREWHAELLSWKWPLKRERKLGKGFLPKTTATPAEWMGSTTTKHKEYLGSLPKTVVSQHEHRIEHVKAGIHALDIDELNNSISQPHAPFLPDNTGTDGCHPHTDFVALIAHARSQSVLYLSKLTILISDWERRITILKQVPYLLSQLDTTRATIEAALKSVYTKDASELVTREVFDGTKASIASDVSLLAAKLEQMVNCLDGRDDSLPATWIDRMVKIEASFAQWSIGAERKLLYMEWMNQNAASFVGTPQSPTTSRPVDRLTSRIKARRRGRAQERKSSREVLQSTGDCSHHFTNETCRVEALDLKRRSESDSHRLPSAGSCRENVSAIADQTFPASSTSGDDDGGRAARRCTSAIDLTTTSSSTTPRPQSQLTSARPSTAGAQKTIGPRCDSPTNVRPNHLNESATDQTLDTRPLRDICTFRASGVNGYRNEHRQVRGSSCGPTPPAAESCIDKSPSMSGAESTLETEPEAMLPPFSLKSAQGSSDSIPMQQNTHLSPLNLLPKAPKRMKSELSLAESTQSRTMSDISTHEIAQATMVEARRGPWGLRQWVKASSDAVSPSTVESPPQTCLDRPLCHRKNSFEHVQGSDQQAGNTSSHWGQALFSTPVKTSEIVSEEEPNSQTAKEGDAFSTGLPVTSTPTVINSASISWIEQIPSHEIREITVSPRKSTSPSMTSPISSLGSSEAYRRRDSAMCFSSAESGSHKSPSGRSSPEGDSEAVRGGKQGSQPPHTNVLPTSSPSTRRQTGLPSIRQRWSRRRSRGPSPEPGVLPNEAGEEKVQLEDDLLELRIQSLLIRIPARICLLRGPPQETLSHSSTTSSSCCTGSAPSIILSPAKLEHSSLPKRTTNPNANVRLFYLACSTKAPYSPPTTLFVRLASENSKKVMVKVAGSASGGWNDLGDFLLEFLRSETEANGGQCPFSSGLTKGNQWNSIDWRRGSVGPEPTTKSMAVDPPPYSLLPVNAGFSSGLDHRRAAGSSYAVSKPSWPTQCVSATVTHSPDEHDLDQISTTKGASADLGHLDADKEVTCTSSASIVQARAGYLSSTIAPRPAGMLGRTNDSLHRHRHDCTLPRFGSTRTLSTFHRHPGLQTSARSRPGRRDRYGLPLTSTLAFPSTTTTATGTTPMTIESLPGAINTNSTVTGSQGMFVSQADDSTSDEAHDAAPAPNIGPSSFPLYGVSPCSVAGVLGVAVKLGANSNLGGKKKLKKAKT